MPALKTLASRAAADPPARPQGVQRPPQRRQAGCPAVSSSAPPRSVSPSTSGSHDGRRYGEGRRVCRLLSAPCCRHEARYVVRRQACAVQRWDQTQSAQHAYASPRLRVRLVDRPQELRVLVHLHILRRAVLRLRRLCELLRGSAVDGVPAYVQLP
eukprot:6196943-Pleurochrysis_carterae.AAC.4